MPNALPTLRRALDIIPSPDADRPGLLLRDPFHYTDAVLYVPRAWVLALQCLDGEHTELDVQELLSPKGARGERVRADKQISLSPRPLGGEGPGEGVLIKMLIMKGYYEMHAPCANMTGNLFYA